jgi:hypothetical protein
MKIGFTSPFLANKVIAIYAVAITAVAGGILLIPAQAPTPNVVYNLFKIGQTSADQTLVSNGWKAIGYSCTAANPSQIAQGLGATVCGYKYTTASHNLITQAGIDWLACVMSRGSNHCANTNNAQYIGLTLDSAAPLIGDTTLANELIATSCGAAASGMQRVLASTPFTHTNLTTAFYTVANTFTAGAGASCTAVQKSGLFTKVAAGTMVFENTFSSTNLIAGDTLAITWTITL